MKKISYFILSAFAVAAVSACDAGDGYWYDSEYASRDGYYPSGAADEGGQGNGNSQAGLITAAEWNDLDNWQFWGDLMNGQVYDSSFSVWKFYTNNRVAFEVKDSEGKAVSGVNITLQYKDEDVWSAVTDNLGRADCWVNLFEKDTTAVDPQLLAVKVNGTLQGSHPSLTAFKCPDGVSMNSIVLDGVSPAADKADIAFFVDATGSMGDEISFLKDDLMDILKQVSEDQSGIEFRTAALFYRDEGDDYVTRHSDFADFKTTTTFISEQNAGGGGDYEEAVHTALEIGLQKLSWDSSAKTRIAFMILDAPAHNDRDAVIESLHKSIRTYAAKGIKIIPIAASSIDKRGEFMLRYFAIATEGTYVFITNDSGIGNDHIEASVGQHDVEILNDLIIRLIKKYTD